MQLTPQMVLVVIGASASVATAIFWGSFYLGTSAIGARHHATPAKNKRARAAGGRRRVDLAGMRTG